MQDPHQSARHSASAAPAEPRRRPLAIVIRLSALGDVLLTAPAVLALSATHDIGFVTEPAYAPLVERLPGVTHVHRLSKRDGWKGALQLGRSLRGLEPALVIDLQAKVRSRLLARAVGAPTQTLRRRTFGQAGRALFGQDTVIDDEHQSRRYGRFVGVDASATPRLTLDPGWIEDADRLASDAGWRSEDRPVAVAPAATHATKSWGPARYAQLVQQNVAPETPLLLVGGPSDLEALRAFQEALGPRARVLDSSSAPLTTLAALLARCRVLVGNDSGPIHLATLLDVPTLAVFGPTSTRRWGVPPGEEESHRTITLGLACSPCSNHGGERCPQGHHDCMNALPVERVAQELAALASSAAPTRRSLPTL